ncbi:MAG: hypothetical protein DRN99_00550 [Thermoproteota archaeon]|nr:MAG: hypothetical protein DRN99_00550 [Candidatus Korarchaeota archaeon]
MPACMLWYRGLTFISWMLSGVWWYLMSVEVTGDYRKITEALLEKARSEADDILNRARSEAEARVKEAETRAKAEAESLLESKVRDAEKEAERLLMDARFKSRQRIAQAREELVEKVFKEAEERIRREYGAEVLENLMRRSVELAGVSELTVYVSEPDLDAAAKIAEKVEREHGVKLKLEASPIVRDGVVVKSADGRIVVDNTLKTRIEQAKKRLRPLIAKIILEKAKVS